MLATSSVAFASTFQFGKESPQVSEEFTSSFLPPKIINIEQYLPPKSSGAFGSFVIFTSNSSVNPNAFCTLFNVTDNAIASYDSIPVANSTGQVKCTFSGSYDSTKQYSFIFTGYSNLVFGSTATTSVLIQDFSGVLVSQALPVFCNSQHLSGSHDNCDNIKTLNLTFDSVGSSTPFFGKNATSTVGVPATCNITDISGCIVNALSWAFIPSPTVLNQFSTLTLASSTPFSYLYEMRGYFITLETGSATSTRLTLPFMSGTLVLWDSNNMESVIGSSFFKLLQIIKQLISYLIWFSVLFIVWREVYGIFAHDSTSKAT